MTDISALEARIASLEHDLAVQQDIEQIRKIQYTYGYFIDKSQWLCCITRDEHKAMIT